MRPLTIETTSLALRQFAIEDAPVLLRLNGEESTRLWLPSHVYSDLEHARTAVAYLIDCYATPGDARRGPYVLGVALRSTGELIGHVGFSPLDGEVEVSYAIAERLRGHGYAVEALAAACGWAAAAFSLPCLVAITASANVASRRVLDRAGFRHRADESMLFQGSEKKVSRYEWSPAGAIAAPARG